MAININVPTIDEQTDKGIQYTYDGQRQKSAINIPAIDEETDKGNQYRITGNFCGVKFLRFWSKKKTFNFCGFLFLRIVNLGTEKKNCLYYRIQEATSEAMLR